MGQSISRDTSLSGRLFSVQKPKVNLTKWDTLLFETSLPDVFITFQGKSGFCREVGDNKTIEPDNEDNQQRMSRRRRKGRNKFE